MDNTILNLFYVSVIESVVIFGIVVWYRGVSIVDKTHMERVRKIAQRIIGLPVNVFTDIFNQRVLSKAKNVMKDSHHPLNVHYELLPSGRRLRNVACRTKRRAESFVPFSIFLCNNE